MREDQIIIKDLTYQYKNQQIIEYPNYTLHGEEHLLIKGPSGCGKSTLLQLIGGLLPIQKGFCSVFGNTLMNLSQRQLDIFRKKHVGIIFQKNHFIASLTMKGNLELFGKIYEVAHLDRRIQEITEELGLNSLLDKKTYLLSEGEQQRLSVARAILHQPQLLLADEPTSSLDDQNTIRIMNLLLEMANKNRSTLLIVSHDQRVSNFMKKELILESQKVRV
jgi:ABC-type lipoprotein export system ATPase subunit